MRTHGHWEGNVTHQGLSGVGAKVRIALGEIPNVDDGAMDAANHQGTRICNKPSRSAHVTQNLKLKKKSKQKNK